MNTAGLICAHSRPNQPVEKWQPLQVHLNQVAAQAARFAEGIDSSDWAWNAGLLHDLGKVAEEFQAYLRRENHIDDPAYDGVGGTRVNHSSAGAALAEERFSASGRPLGRILAYLVAGHHAGLPDWSSCDGGRGALVLRLEEGRKSWGRIRPDAQGFTDALRNLTNLPSFVNANNFHLWVRMLFSCLVDADFLDTEAFIKPERSQERGPGAALENLKHALDQHLDKLAIESPDTPVNQARREILAACRSAAKSDLGIFSLTVPTGGGKTLSATAFALDHAVTHGKRRIIYVIPYTSIIEQTADTLARIFGRENVIEHHSNLDPDRETLRTRLASENWDAPIIITTNVQFFESLHSARPSRCRKLHNLVDSVVILDEAQMVPPELLTPCVEVINDLTQNYKMTLVLSTATQPALPNLRLPQEIIPRDLDLYARLQRTVIDVPDLTDERLSWDSLADLLQMHDQVLCIVNTRRDCHDLFKLMPEGTVHLSALMCGEHRSRVIADIKERLRKSEPLRVISTQLVEAGVDIDFPVVYRALAGLDSIAQAAGRCNREGNLDGGGKVIVFVPPKGAPRGLLHKGEGTTRELSSLPDFDPQSPEWFTRYFDLFYSKVNDTGEKDLREKLTPSDPRELDLAFRTYGNNFRLIRDEHSRPVFVRYGEGEKLIRTLRRDGPNRQLLRRLQRYTVNVPLHQVDLMRSAGLLEEIPPGFLAQSDLGHYDDTLGLPAFEKTARAEDLVL